MRRSDAPTTVGRHVRGSTAARPPGARGHDDDRRPAGGQAAQPGTGHLARGRPAQVQRDVARGDAVGQLVVGLEVAGERHAVASGRGARCRPRDRSARARPRRAAGARRARTARVAANASRTCGMRLSGVSPPKHAEDERVRRDAVAGAGAPRARRAASATDSGVPWPSRIDVDARRPGCRALQRGRRAGACGRPTSLRGVGHEPRHRPGVVEVVVEARDRELGQVRVGVGMVPGELGAVVVGPEPCGAGPPPARGADARRAARSGRDT